MGSSVGGEGSAGAVLGAWTCVAGARRKPFPVICKRINAGCHWVRDHLHHAGEKARGRWGSGADKTMTGLAMALGVSGMEQRESLVLWLWHQDLPGFRMVPR